MIDAIVFDFDGLIADTEGPSYQAWRETFEHFGCVLTEEEHVPTIGAQFDRLEWLKARATVGLPSDDDVRALKQKRHLELLGDLEVLAGVEAWLDEADAHGLPLAIASSSPPSWVNDHLERLGLRHRFRAVSCCEGDMPPKPAPDCYLAACDALGVAASRALAVEDSANGVAAAKTAGLWCVAVPNALTRRLDLSAADVEVASLADITLAEVLRTLAAR
jgi:HAD superfamily hydrolase (TIGR01509 family)